MASEGSRVGRPWTVYVLVVASLVGLVSSLFLDTDRTIWDLVSVPLSLWWAYALWTGRSWAFSWAFMLTALCAVLLVGVVLVQILLLEMNVPAGVWWSLLLGYGSSF